MYDFTDKTVLITGGTGSFGSRLIERLLAEHAPRAIRIFSRDEYKQSEMAHRLAGDDRMRFLIGDVRSLPRLLRATRNVDVIIHAAALKHVPICEYNPFEAVQTNVIGAENVVAAAMENEVPLTIALSTDKAVNPVNLYGATKLCQEKIVTQGNAYAADTISRFACVRYGNVVGSRGSVVPLFKRQARRGRADDHRRPDDALLDHAGPGDRLRALVARPHGRRRDLRAQDPEHADHRHGRGARAGRPAPDRRHAARARSCTRPADRRRGASQPREPAGFKILPEYPFVPLREHDDERALPEGFRYESDNNDAWLGVDELRAMA